MILFRLLVRCILLDPLLLVGPGFFVFKKEISWFSFQRKNQKTSYFKSHSPIASHWETLNSDVLKLALTWLLFDSSFIKFKVLDRNYVFVYLKIQKRKKRIQWTKQIEKKMEKKRSIPQILEGREFLFLPWSEKNIKKLVSLFVTLGTVQELLSFDRRVSYYNCS